jgi:hypothetical protein
MTLEKKPFIEYDFFDEDEPETRANKQSNKREIFPLSLNAQEIEWLKEDMKALQQSKPSTALKQMWKICRFVIHDSEMGKIAKMLSNNIRRNVRIGINDVEPELDANVKLKR